MKIFEITGFKSAETGLASYDDILKNPDYYAKAKRKKVGVVMMRPMEYIKKATKGFQKSRPELTVTELIASRDLDLVDKYAQEMRDGAEFPTLSLYYADGFSQEGLHRALAAMKAGIKEVPVMMISATRKKDRGKLKPTY